MPTKLPRVPRIGARNRNSFPRAKVKLPGVKERERMTRATPPARDPAKVEVARREFTAAIEQLGQEKTETDRQIEALRPKIARMRELQDESEKKSKPLTVEEKVIILEAHFGNGIGAKIIGRELGRDPSVVTRFLQNYKSTVPIARKIFEASAETLAKRVVKQANVQEALEVLDRTDVLPKKNRGGDQGGSKFTVVVGMPSQSAGQGSLPPVPDQTVIEASLVNKPADGD